MGEELTKEELTELINQLPDGREIILQFEEGDNNGI